MNVSLSEAKASATSLCFSNNFYLINKQKLVAESHLPLIAPTEVLFVVSSTHICFSYLSIRSGHLSRVCLSLTILSQYQKATWYQQIHCFRHLTWLCSSMPITWLFCWSALGLGVDTLSQVGSGSVCTAEDDLCTYQWYALSPIPGAWRELGGILMEQAAIPGPQVCLPPPLQIPHITLLCTVCDREVWVSEEFTKNFPKTCNITTKCNLNGLGQSRTSPIPLSNI